LYRKVVRGLSKGKFKDTPEFKNDTPTSENGWRRKKSRRKKRNGKE